MKFSQEEIEVMKEVFGKGKKWIARCSFNQVWASEKKPFKDYFVNAWITNDYTDIELNNKLFSFIKWEDEKPFYIGDLFEINFNGEIE